MRVKDHSYEHPEKILAREAALRAAVLALSERRAESAAVRQSYVREARDQLLRQGGLDREKVAQLDGKYIRSWEQFHESEVSRRTAGELRVAYLAGPNPVPDFLVLRDLGVHPHNIWAFESNGSAFANATTAVAGSDFRMLKLINQKVEDFLQSVPQTFDLFYFDACGAIPSKQRTLRVIATAMANQRITSPGVVLTNFASPFNNPEDRAGPYSDLVASYLYPKAFLCGLDPSAGEVGFTEGAECHGYTGKEFTALVSQAPDFFYSEFITRQLMDLGLILTPARRIGNSGQWRRLFSDDVSKLKSALVAADPDLYISRSDDAPLSTTHDTLFGGPASAPLGLLGTSNAARNWRVGVNGLPGLKHSAIDCAMAIEAARLAYGQAWSDELRLAVKESLAARMFQFCDVPMASTIVDPMLHQIGYPYHYAPRLISRWSYVAKETRMFMDLFVLDACRYVYDWLPSLHLIEKNFADISQQLVFRLALDGIAKTRRWYNPEVLSGTAVIDQSTPGFAAETLSPRVKIN